MYNIQCGFRRGAARPAAAHRISRVRRADDGRAIARETHNANEYDTEATAAPARGWAAAVATAQRANRPRELCYQLALGPCARLYVCGERTYRAQHCYCWREWQQAVKHEQHMWREREWQQSKKICQHEQSLDPSGATHLVASRGEIGHVRPLWTLSVG